MDFNGDGERSGAILQRIKDVITGHADRIREIEFRGTRPHFNRSFGKSQDFEVVTFAEEGVVGWTEAMEMAESQVDAVAFPSLHTISMVDVAFDSKVLPGIRFNAFESCLRKRHSHNVGLIRKLTLARCHNIGSMM